MVNKRNVVIVGGEDIEKHYAACEWGVKNGLLGTVAIAPFADTEDNKNILLSMSLPSTGIDIENDWMIIKGNIHTEDFLRRVIPLAKKLNGEKKLFLSHCAYFTNPYINRSFILTDGACVPTPTIEQREMMIENAVNLYNKLHDVSSGCNVSFISAGGDTNPKVDPEVYDWWKNRDTNKIPVRLEQLDVALNEEIRVSKGVTGSVADVVVVKDINQGNAIWKSLTAVSGSGWNVSGLLVGAKFPIILTSRGDSCSSIKGSIKLGIKVY